MTVSKEKGVQKVVRKGGELGEPGQGEKIIRIGSEKVLGSENFFLVGY